jgi:hypothetical protein
MPKSQPALEATPRTAIGPTVKEHSGPGSDQGESYLLQNIHKTGQGNRGWERPRGKPKEEGAAKRQPIKIEIEIPLEEFGSAEPLQLQDYEMESNTAWEKEETEIIREVTQRVLCLLQRSPQVGARARP